MACSALLDLRNDCDIQIFEDFGVVDVITLAGFTNLDAGYTISITKDTTTQTYTVGSGLTLGVNSIAWSLDTSALSTGIWKGTLISDSRVAGVYFKANIELTLV